MMEQEDKSILSALRSEPEKTALLIKLVLVAVVTVVAWDILAGKILPDAIVKVGLVALFLAYSMATTFLVARIMLSARLSMLFATTPRPEPVTVPGRGARDLDIRALRTRYAQYDSGPDAERDDNLVADNLVALEAVSDSEYEEMAVATVFIDSMVFNQAYFLMRLQEHVKDARRDGREMCVVSVDITMPGQNVTPEVADRIASEMARIASKQHRVIGQPLALSDSEYIFSMPTTGPNDAKVFVSEVIQALGDYWCHFGIAAFPRTATDAEGLVARAREACDESRQGGKPRKVQYPASA